MFSKGSITIMNNIFISNSAQEGGAIGYEKLRPIMANNTFIDNSAVYGNIISSFPDKIKFVKISDKNQSQFEVLENILGKLRPFSTSYTIDYINLALFDFDDQLVNRSDTSM